MLFREELPDGECLKLPHDDHCIARLSPPVLSSPNPSPPTGIALDTRRIDKVLEVCEVAIRAGKAELLCYTFNLCQSARNIRPR